MKMKTKNFLKRVIAAMLPVLLLGMYSVPCFAGKTDTPTIANNGMPSPGTSANTTPVTDIEKYEDTIEVELGDKTLETLPTYTYKYQVGESGDKVAITAETVATYLTITAASRDVSGTKIKILKAFFEKVTENSTDTNAKEVTLYVVANDGTEGDPKDDSDLLAIYKGNVTPAVAAPTLTAAKKYIYDARNKKWYDGEVKSAKEINTPADTTTFEMKKPQTDTTIKVHVGNGDLETHSAYNAPENTNVNTNDVNAKVEGTNVIINKALFETVAKITDTNKGMFVYAYANKEAKNSKPVLVAQFTVVNGELEASFSKDDFGLAKAEASDYDAPSAAKLKIEEVAEGDAKIPEDAIWSGDISLVDGKDRPIEYKDSINLVLYLKKGDDATWNFKDKVDVHHVVNGNDERIATGVEIEQVEGSDNIGTVEFTSKKGLSPFYITFAAVDSGEGSKDEQSAGQQVEDKDEASKKEDDKDTTSSGKGKSGSGAKTKTGDATFALQGLAAMITTGLGLFVMKRKFRK